MTAPAHRLRATALPALVVAALLLAGCNGGPIPVTPSTPPSSTTSSSTASSTSSAAPPPPPAFDGEAALAFVRAFALRDDGTPRYRIPGTEGQAEGAAYLWGATQVPGWTRSWQNLTGADYEALNLSAVRGYRTPGPYDAPGDQRGCTHAEFAAVRTLPFHNLLAVRGDGTRPLVLVGAHWDSQMHSDYDRDPAKRDLPDPGANDGASGVGVLLQLMRALDGIETPFDVGVLFIDGEDGFFDCYPLAGSLAFTQTSGVDVDAFILLDMVGDPDAKYPREGYSKQSAPWLQDILWSHGQALSGTEHFLDDTRSIVDDHVAFIQAGVPSVDVIDAGRPTTFPPYWDTTQDTVDNLDADMLALVGQTVVGTLMDPRLALAIGQTG